MFYTEPIPRQRKTGHAILLRWRRYYQHSPPAADVHERSDAIDSSTYPELKAET
ncbi:hypothetical protein [Citrobacter sp. Cpo107]|uniref:hypothetical protein n=1 Tax=Citrobacter TaxID=544 RepID=UPI002576B3E2|nr:hypothetical protein [Citrobacter sp. Cpo107]MDM2807627.1 hypothetical protein [Citrobacter sp. Cpo107]